MKLKLLLLFVSILLTSCINDTKSNKSKNDSLNGIVKSSADSSSLKKTREVFGFHPYWQGNSFKNYNYNLLTSVSYFAYDLDPITGNYRTIRDWETTKLIDSAKANNIKIYLTVTNLTTNNNKVFLTNELAQETSIHTILQLLKTREAHGVTINFENIPCELKNNYTNYIQNLSNRLKAFNKTVVVIVPAINIRKCIDIENLNKYVEYFVIMAKDYYGPDSSVAGPVAPLYGGNLWTRGSIENTIDSYLEGGLPKEKIILTIPYYGNKWQTEDDKVPSNTKKFISALTYKTIKKKYPQKVYFEPVSQTNYLNFKEDEKFFQVWFDDARSLGKKYDFINTKELGGVGIWALGYDEGYPELWDVLKEKFEH